MGYMYTPRKTVYRLAREQLHLNEAKLWRPIGVVFGLTTICIIILLLLTASDRTKYSLKPGKLCVGTVKIYSLQRRFRYSGFFFHIYCNSAGLSNVRYNGVFVIAGCHCIRLWIWYSDLIWPQGLSHVPCILGTERRFQFIWIPHI